MLTSRLGFKKCPLPSFYLASEGPWRSWSWRLSSIVLILILRTVLSYQGSHRHYTTNQNVKKPALLLRVASTPGISDPTKECMVAAHVGKSKWEKYLLWEWKLFRGLIQGWRTCFQELRPSPKAIFFCSSRAGWLPSQSICPCYSLSWKALCPEIQGACFPRFSIHWGIPSYYI